MTKKLQDLRYVTIPTSEGDIRILPVTECDPFVVKAYYAATTSLKNVKYAANPNDVEREKWSNHLAALMSIHKLFIMSYFIYGSGWNVDTASMTTFERVQWEMDGMRTISAFHALNLDELGEFIRDFRYANEDALESEAILAALEQQLEDM